MKHHMIPRPGAKWLPAAKGLTATAALMLSIGNATAAILILDASALGSSFNGKRGFLTFDGTAFTASTVVGDYHLRYGLDYGDGRFRLTDFNSSYTGDGFTPVALAAGSAVGDGNSFDGNYNTYDTAKFPAAPPGGSYFGFKYGTGTVEAPSFHYGWLNLSADGAKLAVISGAINTTAGESIQVGQTLAAVPEPTGALGTLGLLAGGIFFRRRKLAA